MRYSLRSLILVTAVAPPLLASIYWTALWLHSHPIALGLTALVALTATWFIGPVLCYRELIRLLCGPDAFRPLPRKIRRRTRYRLERYSAEST